MAEGTAPLDRERRKLGFFVRAPRFWFGNAPPRALQDGGDPKGGMARWAHCMENGGVGG